MHGVKRGRERHVYDLSWNWGREDIVIMCYKNTVIADLSEVMYMLCKIMHGTQRACVIILDKHSVFVLHVQYDWVTIESVNTSKR